MGRPSVPIDEKVVEGMASVGATNVEIADFVGVDEALIRRRCKDVLTKARAGLKTRLRQAQLKAALGGNPTMLIWLGKQMLGQADQTHFKVGDLTTLSDDELRSIAEGKVPK